MTQQEYTALVDRAKQLSYEYYVLAQPTVSDAQFDALVSEIEQAESDHPEWTLADSPTQQVGSDLQDNGRRLVRHRTRMLSCQKAQTQEAVMKWLTQTEKKLKKVNDLHYVLEWKLDGISCSLVYQDGRLISAATRGDKNCGQDLLAHVMRMSSVPQHINMTGRVEVRGEIVCPKAELAALGYKDCRTAAAALTNQVVPSCEVERLVFLAWQMDSDEQPFGTETAGMVVAGEQGFKTSGYKGCWGNDVLARLDDFAAKREALEWPTDGVVIKIDCKPLAASLGYTEHHPKGNIAYKFGAQKTVTRVLRIEVSVGATGKRTPVAYLEPVMIMGREVKQASLYSERKMTELGVTEGCTVEVGLSNDVTPKIYRVIEAATETTTDGTDNYAEPEAIEETTDNTDCTDNEPAIVTNEPLTMNPEPLTMNPEPLTMNQPRPRRQRKPRKPRVERQTIPADAPTRSLSDIRHQTSDIDRHQTSSTLKAVGMVAAATVALFVIYETGLLIPLGLIGLATGGLLK
jgi:DNA ligase (NAD+)